MAQVAIQLTADMVLSDNGGRYEAETGTDAEDIQEKARVRVAAYQKAGDTVSFDNQLDEGEQKIMVVGNATI